MKLLKTALFSLSALMLAACHPNTPAAPAAATDIVATVNGDSITRDMYNLYLNGYAQQQNKDPATLTQQDRENLLDSLIKLQLVAQQATKDGVTKDPRIVALIDLQRMNVMQQGFLERFTKENKPTDAELQAAQLSHSEYHVEHILVTTQDAAAKVIDELNKGAKFEDLAKKESTDTKDEGGDLGWQTIDRLPKPLADAIVALQPGDYTRVPVQTVYGWHVVKLVETRPLTPQAFDAAKARVTNVVLDTKFLAYVSGLLAKAQIDKKM
jgi:peptidyl-prolyl cis-trans isomerase C